VTPEAKKVSPKEGKHWLNEEEAKDEEKPASTGKRNSSLNPKKRKAYEANIQLETEIIVPADGELKMLSIEPPRKQLRSNEGTSDRRSTLRSAKNLRPV